MNRRAFLLIGLAALAARVLGRLGWWPALADRWTHWSERERYNALIRQQFARGQFGSGVRLVDAGATNDIGIPGAANNVHYYVAPDTIHPTAEAARRNGFRVWVSMVLPR